MSKTESLRANVDSEEKERFERVAETIDVPLAQIIREGTRKEIQRLEKTHPKLKTQTAEATA
jgi:antitoxin component of RelBE/YafQ-DinJ toxin-antitoxin module